MDSKGYGIATRPGTPFKPLLDQAILKLMEGGTLHRLRVKWWKQKRGGGACDAKVCLTVQQGGDACDAKVQYPKQLGFSK